MNKEDLHKRVENDFTYRSPSNEQIQSMEMIRKRANDYAHLLVELCPYSRELSTSLTHLETAVMFANASIAREVR